MLDNERYNLAKRALLNIYLHKAYGTSDQETFEWILSEHYHTQLALESLGANARTHPVEIRGINQTILPNERPRGKRKPLAIHVIGMPKTLKTTMRKAIEQIGDRRIGRKEIRISTQTETAGALHRIYEQKFGEVLDFEEFLMSQVMANTIELKLESLYSKKSRCYSVLINRGPIDIIPFTWANFLFGRLSQDKFQRAVTNIQTGLRPLEDFQNAIILLLVTPEESLRRNQESGNPQGRVMNPKFLPFLYEQYLKLHWQLMDSDGRRPWSGEEIPYACLDMSGQRIRGALERYTAAWANILKFYFG